MNKLHQQTGQDDFFREELFLRVGLGFSIGWLNRFGLGGYGTAIKEAAH